MRIALVVPCFNEAARLDIAALCAACVEGHELELLLVDDGSRDGTRRLLEKIARERSDTRVLAYDRNAGKAEAVRRGILDAVERSPDAVGYWDADLATPISELPTFVEVLLEHPAIDIVIGSRVKLMGRVIERHKHRHYPGRVFATGASIALDLPVYDTQCGAKLFRATPLLERVFETSFRSRWVFDVEVLARFAALAPRGTDYVAGALYEVPLKRWTDIHGSKVKPTDFLRAAADLAWIRTKYRPRRAT